MTEIKIETKEELKHLLKNIGTLPAGNYRLIISSSQKKNIMR